MDTAAKSQRRKALRKIADSSVIHVETRDDGGNVRWVTANLVDILANGCGLALVNVLKSGSTVVVRGTLSANRAAEQLRASVRWCAAKADGTFRAGLEFLDGRTRVEPEAGRADIYSADSATPDWYEVMQVSPNADASSISHAYRTLAFRYHPDNRDTGNSEMFIRLSEAHRILSDPEPRASYDLNRNTKWRWGSKVDRTAVPGEWEKRAATYLGIVSVERTVCWEG